MVNSIFPPLFFFNPSLSVCQYILVVNSFKQGCPSNRNTTISACSAGFTVVNLDHLNWSFLYLENFFESEIRDGGSNKVDAIAVASLAVWTSSLSSQLLWRVCKNCINSLLMSLPHRLFWAHVVELNSLPLSKTSTLEPPIWNTKQVRSSQYFLNFDRFVHLSFPN